MMPSHAAPLRTFLPEGFPSLVQALSGMSLMHYPIFHPARSKISYLLTSVSSSSTMLQGQGAEEGQHGA